MISLVSILMMLSAKPVNDSIAKLETPFSINRHTFTDGDAIRLKFPVPHGGDLWIVAPDGAFFPICFWNTDPAGPKPKYAYEDFRHVGSMDLSVDSLLALPFRHDSHIEHVFEKKGRYKVLLSENIATDDGTPVFEQKLFYKPKK